MLKTIYKQFNLNNHNSINQQTNLYRNSEEDEIIKNLSFEIYLKEMKSNSSNQQGQTSITKSFKNVQAFDLIKQIGLKRSSRSRSRSKLRRQITSFLTNHLPFEYNLTNLMPNTQYTFELAARMFNLESHMSSPVKFLTLRKFLFCYQVKVVKEQNFYIRSHSSYRKFRLKFFFWISSEFQTELNFYCLSSLINVFFF